MKINILLSYAYKKTLETWLRKYDFTDSRLMVDSGAFTVWKSGGSIDLNEYMDFINFNVKPVVNDYTAIQLDVIGDARATRKNLDIMASRCSNVLPVFTKGEQYAALTDILSVSDYICLGGLVGSACDSYIEHICKMIPQARVHLLGYGKQKQLKKIRPFSFDVSNMLDLFRFGKFVSWDYVRAELVTVKKMDFYNIHKNNSLVTDKRKFLSSCENASTNDRAHVQKCIENMAAVVIVQQYILQAAYFYCMHNTRSYFSVSSPEPLFIACLNPLLKSSEVLTYIALLKGAKQ